MVVMIKKTCGKIDGLNIHVDVAYPHVKRIPLSGLHKYSYRGLGL
jgi:hypothetical protein